MPQEISRTQRVLILLTLTTTVALYAMTVTIANVSLPQMQGALSATQDQIAWVVTFNIVATAVATPMTGWLTARFGQRRLILFCVAGFTLSSFLCGTADSLEALVLFRIGQGVFGAPLPPMGQAITMAAYPQRLHGQVNAVFGIGVMVGPILAPTIGGYLSEAYSWRLVFYMIVPFGIMSFLACWTFIGDGGRKAASRLDWTGFLVLAASVAAFQFMLDRGERESWFESPEIIIEAAIAGIGIYLFIIHSATAERPFLNPALIRDRNFSIGIILIFIFGMLNFTPMTLLPPLMKNLQGYPDSVIGALLAMRGAGTLVGFFTILVIGSRFDPRFWLVTGFALQGLSGILMAQFDITVPFQEITIAILVQGLGVGLLWVPLTLVTFSTLRPDYLPEGTSVYHLLRNLGSSVHISISVALVLRLTKINYGHLTESISEFDKAFQFPWVLGSWNPTTTQGLAAVAGEVQRQGLMIGYVNAFYFYAATAFVVMPLILLVSWRRPAR
jgi:DHA2 family multidrug resistance protein